MSARLSAYREDCKVATAPSDERWQSGGLGEFHVTAEASSTAPYIYSFNRRMMDDFGKQTYGQTGDRAPPRKRIHFETTKANFHRHRVELTKNQSHIHRFWKPLN
jgi:hypothetical protein